MAVANALPSVKTAAAIVTRGVNGTGVAELADELIADDLLRGVAALGSHSRAPSVHEVLSVLEDPKINVSIDLLGISLADRPAFFAQLIPNLQAMRTRTGRPHWLVLDEAHHMLPETWGHAGSSLPQRLGETILVTVHADHVGHGPLGDVMR